jgi:L-threonine-O-3-phosphate decarboxylase
MADCDPRDILDFSASINPLGLPSSASLALRENLDLVTRYPDPDYPRLRQIIADFHGIAPHFVLPGNGVAELLTWAGRELAQLGPTLLFTPAFADYGRAIAAHQGEIVQTKLNLDTYDLELGDRICRGVIVNNPHNPTGHLWSKGDLLPLLAQFELVVVDEAFMDFVPNSSVSSVMELVEAYPNLVVLRSLTKFYCLAGLRLGYAIAHPSRLAQWQAWRDPWAVNGLATPVTAAVLGDRTFQAQTMTWLISARAKLYQGLQTIDYLQPLPSEANFFLVKSERSVVELQQYLLKKYQILIRDCLSFAELGDRYFRIAVRTSAENHHLLTALATYGP